MKITGHALILGLGLVSGMAHAAVKFTAPASGSVINAKSILRGSCSGSKDVQLIGPGIDVGKKVSCQSDNHWEYALTNAYQNMPEGKFKMKAKQGGSASESNFVKKSGVVATMPVISTPVSQTPPVTSAPVTSTPVSIPASTIDLTTWKITLPIDSAGSKSGTAVEVKNLTAAFEKKPYYFKGADGALVFMAPVDGATTSGSHYPRSELRELTATGANAAWTAAQGGSMSATLAVNELPVTSTGAKGRVVIGQIHGPNDELCRLYYDNGRIYFYDDKAGSAQKETQFILKSNAGSETNIPLNAQFSYSIIVANNILSVSVSHNGSVYSASENLSNFWPGQALYYKAGVYVQVATAGSGAGTVGSGQGQVSFYKLSRPVHN